MIGVLVVTHGQLADELVRSASMIVGEVENLRAVSLGWADEVEDARARIAEAVRKLDVGHGVLILTDMFGGTPTNISLTLLERGRVEIITGVNLPMVLKLAGSDESDLTRAAAQVKEQGQKSIYVAGDVLARQG